MFFSRGSQNDFRDSRSSLILASVHAQRTFFGKAACVVVYREAGNEVGSNSRGRKKLHHRLKAGLKDFVSFAIYFTTICAPLDIPIFYRSSFRLRTWSVLQKNEKWKLKPCSQSTENSFQRAEMRTSSMK